MLLSGWLTFENEKDTLGALEMSRLNLHISDLGYLRSPNIVGSIFKSFWIYSTAGRNEFTDDASGWRQNMCCTVAPLWQKWTLLDLRICWGNCCCFFMVLYLSVNDSLDHRVPHWIWIAATSCMHMHSESGNVGLQSELIIIIIIIWLIKYGILRNTCFDILITQ